MERQIPLPEEELRIPQTSLWAKLPAPALATGIAALLVSFVLGFRGTADDRTAFFFSYLFAYVFFLTIALGGLFFVLLQYLTRAGWSVVVRRLAECVMATMPAFAVLVFPILIWYDELYPWAHATGDPLLEHKSGWLDPTFFIARSIVYLGVWTFLAWYFLRQSRRQDETGEAQITRRLQSRSALGMVLFAVTLNFAAFDWVMSLDPLWFSTIFGVYLFAGSVVAILAALILLGLRLQSDGCLRTLLTWEHYHDVGKLLFGFIVFWAYIGFSQFMLIWYGNIPEETSWFHQRWGDGWLGWQGVSTLLAAGHFGLPFLFLLSSDFKRRRWSLQLAAGWMLVMHMVDVYWLVMPNLPILAEGRHGPSPSIFDLTCLVAIGGHFLALLAWVLRRGSLVPVRDPRLAESLAFENV